jgi:inhibitor of the pro-sigma K processing machinery
MLKTIWLWMFIGSVAGLVLLLLRRTRIGWVGWVSRIAVNLVVAGVLMYLVGLAEPYTHLHLPVNAATAAAVTLLGVPGLAMLAGLKLLVVV